MAKIVAHPYSFGRELCEILGLDPSKTKNIIIKVMTDDVVMVQVDQYLLNEEADKLIELMRECKLSNVENNTSKRITRKYLLSMEQKRTQISKNCME